MSHHATLHHQTGRLWLAYVPNPVDRGGPRLTYRVEADTLAQAAERVIACCGVRRPDLSESPAEAVARGVRQRGWKGSR